jgi:transcriptional regulator with XRE-family HTH domain
MLGIVERMDADARSNALGEYLSARRALVTPEQLGLPASARRRVAGLRREEVALLAGISVDYYLRLEKGRDSNPSRQVLEALARVLRLDEVESAYLVGLTSPRQHARRPRRTERVPSRLHHLLAALEVPAFVEGRYFDVLASNSAAVALSPRLVPGQNRLRSLLLDPEEKEFHSDWDEAVVAFVAAARQTLGEDVGDPRAVELIGELSIASARFRTLWARHDVRALEGGSATINHPAVGALSLHREKMPVGDLILVVYYPDEHSATAEKLRLLATLETGVSEFALDDQSPAPSKTKARRQT